MYDLTYLLNTYLDLFLSWMLNVHYSIILHVCLFSKLALLMCVYQTLWGNFTLFLICIVYDDQCMHFCSLHFENHQLCISKVNYLTVLNQQYLHHLTVDERRHLTDYTSFQWAYIIDYIIHNMYNIHCIHCIYYTIYRCIHYIIYRFHIIHIDRISKSISLY